MKRNNSTSLSIAKEVKTLLVKLREMSDKDWNWDVFLIDMIESICSQYNLDLDLDDELKQRIEILKTKPLRRI